MGFDMIHLCVKLTILFAILLFAMVLGSVANAQDALQDQIFVLSADEQGSYPLGPYLDVFEDPSSSLTFEEVSSVEFAEQFTPNMDNIPNYGFTDSADRVRLSLNNPTDRPVERFLEAGYANMQFVDLYTPDPDSEGYSVIQTGALRPPETRDVIHPRMVFKLALPPQSEETLYLRFQSGASVSLPLTLWMPDAFRQASQREHMVRGLYFGALGILLVYNLLLLFSLRERSYLYLVMLLASMIVFEAGYVGYTGLYVLPRLFHLRIYYQTLSFTMLFVSMLLFTDALLELRVRLPKIHWVIMAIVSVWVLLLILTPVLRFRVIASLMVPWALPTLAVIFTAGVISWSQGFRFTRFFMIAWSGLLVALFFSVLTRLGVLPSTVLSEGVYRIGFIWMAVCWSFALADRINLLQTKTADANLALLESESRLSQILEALPLGVVVYGTDQKPQYINQRIVEIFGNQAREMGPGHGAERTLSRAMEYYSMQVAGSGQPYPHDKMPIFQALLGESASVDDAEIDLIHRRVPLEMWAAPVKDQGGNVQLAVVAIHDITRRKRMETERDEYRNHLEELVAQRTAERKNLEDVLTKLAEWLSSVGRIQRSLSDSADLQQVDQKLLSAISHIMDAENVFTCIWESQDDLAQVSCCRRSGTAFPEYHLALVDLPSDSSLRSQMAQNEVKIVPADRGSPLLAPLATCLDGVDIQSVVFVPIVSDSTTIGLLGLGLQRPSKTLAAEEEFLLYRMRVDLVAVAEYAGGMDHEVACSRGRTQPVGTRPARFGHAGALFGHTGGRGAADHLAQGPGTGAE